MGDKGKVAVQFWIIQTLNGIAYGMLLFLLSAGLSLILGMMGIAKRVVARPARSEPGSV